MSGAVGMMWAAADTGSGPEGEGSLQGLGHRAGFGTVLNLPGAAWHLRRERISVSRLISPRRKGYFSPSMRRIELMSGAGFAILSRCRAGCAVSVLWDVRARGPGSSDRLCLRDAVDDKAIKSWRESNSNKTVLRC